MPLPPHPPPPFLGMHIGQVCSAGKLRKRAEENRKVDLYDAMGADILRALQRKGLEEQVGRRTPSPLYSFRPLLQFLDPLHSFSIPFTVSRQLYRF